MPGFDFSNYNRNAALHARGVPLPKATSTGTTIVGCIYDNGVVVSLPFFHDEAQARTNVNPDRSRHSSNQWAYSGRQGKLSCRRHFTDECSPWIEL